MLDFHNHLMPGVDDGAADVEESRVGLEMLRSHGVRDIITTPHLRGSLTERSRELDIYLGTLDRSWEVLKALATEEFPELRIERGVELMLDIPRPNLTDPRLRLAGSAFALVEFPFMSIPPHSTRAVQEIVSGGWIPIIAHPERYSNMPANYDLVQDWRDAGAYVQVNSGSLLSYYGAGPKRIAWSLLSQGGADYLSSDYHSRGNCSIKASSEELTKRGAAAQLRLLTRTNPERVLRGEPPVPVPPLDSKPPSRWKRVFPWR